MKNIDYLSSETNEILLIKKDIKFLSDTILELKTDMKFLSKLIFLINGGAIVLGVLLK